MYSGKIDLINKRQRLPIYGSTADDENLAGSRPCSNLAGSRDGTSYGRHPEKAVILLRSWLRTDDDRGTARKRMTETSQDRFVGQSAEDHGVTDSKAFEVAQVLGKGPRER